LRARQWAIFWMAVWLAGTVFIAIVATQNFYTIDRLLQSSPNEAFQDAVDQTGRDLGRELLRYLSSELNRLYFQYWNLAQIAIGIFILWLVVKLPKASRPKWVIVSMLSVVLLMTVWITPEMLSVGRRLDFVPRDPLPPGLRTFGLLHAAYTVMDGIVLILGITATLWLVKVEDERFE
jgi:hypothetical protein